jgi:hypothetical protein
MIVSVAKAKGREEFLWPRQEGFEQFDRLW